MQQHVLASGGVNTEAPIVADTTDGGSSSSSKYTWGRFALVCDKTLWAKVKAISQKEGVSMRDLFEYMIQKGIAGYEKKNGTIEVSVDTPGKKRLKDIM